MNNLGDATSQAKPGSVRALSRHLVMGGPRETLRQVRLVRGQREAEETAGGQVSQGDLSFMRGPGENEAI